MYVMYVCMYVCVYVYVYLYLYLYIRMYTYNVYVCIYIYTQPSKSVFLGVSETNQLLAYPSVA